MHRGYVKLWRKVLETKTASRGISYIGSLPYLVVKANHKPGWFLGREIPRGSLATSLPSLAEEWAVSVQSVRTILANLEADGFIKNESTARFRVITICNYEAYQCDESMNQQASNSLPTVYQQAANSLPTGCQQQSKNEKNEKNNTENTAPQVAAPVLTGLELDKPESSKRSKEKPAKLSFEEAASFPLPAAVATPRVSDAWRAWMECRYAAKGDKRPTRRAMEMAAADLVKWGEAKAHEALRNAVNGCWTGLFEPKGGAATVGIAYQQPGPSPLSRKVGGN